jgi:PsbP
VNRELIIVIAGIASCVIGSSYQIALGQNQTSGTSNWLRHENSTYGFKVSYPSDWKIEQLKNNPTAVVRFVSNSKQVGIPDNPMREVSVTIRVENVSKYLDPNNLKVKSLTLDDYISNKKNELSQSATGMSFTYLMDNRTQIAGREAWSVEYMINVERKQTSYILGDYVINDGKLYTIEFSAPPLKVPENLPTAQKMIESFQFTR